MLNRLSYRRALLEDISVIVNLLTEDDLSKTREQLPSQNLEECYIDVK